MTTSSYKIMKTSTIRMNFKQMDNLALESKFCQIHEVHEGSLHLIVFAYRMKVLTYIIRHAVARLGIKRANPATQPK